MPISLFSQPYRLGVLARNAMYDRGLFRSRPLGVRTISVGNITTGGTGKTPLVAKIAEMLADSGEKVCILTRGYGRQNAGSRVVVADGNFIEDDPAIAGDEPAELARRLQSRAVIIADARRYEAGLWARQEFGITTFVLDDGFQHRQVARDLDIVCIDATDPFSGGKMLPIGRLREPVESLGRAGAVVITRSDLVKSVDEIRRQITKIKPEMPIFTCSTVVRGFADLADYLAGVPTAVKMPPRALAFCALGNPRNFLRSIERAGIGVAGSVDFPDHHYYTAKDVEKIEEAAAKAGAHALVTTAKDAVKLKNAGFNAPCFVMEIEVAVADADEFIRLTVV